MEKGARFYHDNAGAIRMVVHQKSSDGSSSLAMPAVSAASYVHSIRSKMAPLLQVCYLPVVWPPGKRYMRDCLQMGACFEA
jgi:hypothetical protein